MNLRHVLLGAAAGAVCASAAVAERGSDGQLNILYWQAVSIMTPYLSNGTKDLQAASLVLEPLARYDEKGDAGALPGRRRFPRENGGVAADLKSITWKLEGWAALVRRHAGDRRGRGLHLAVLHRPERRLRPAAELQRRHQRRGGRSADDQGHASGARSRFPTGRFVGRNRRSCRRRSSRPASAQPRRRAPRPTPSRSAPGRSSSTDFKSGDVVTYAPTPSSAIRPSPPSRPSLLQGWRRRRVGGAARCFETGDVDYAWNALVEPGILAQMAARARRARSLSAFGALRRAAPGQPDRSRPGARREARSTAGAPASRS